MDRTGQTQNMKIEINNPIKTSNPNTNNISASKMSPNEDQLSKEVSKINQFMFTPLESFLLNKKMPRGFKFESEENILKTLELSKNNQRKVKQKGFLQEPKIHIKQMKNNINEDKKNLAEKEQSIKAAKKPKKLEKEVSKNISNTNMNNNNSNINTNISKIEGNNSEAYKVRIKCTSGFNRIKSSPGANLFYTSKIIDAPSLSKIENKINNFEYKTLNECFDDIRKVWNYQFKNHAKDPGIYQNICRLSSFTENVFKELLAEKNTFNEKKEEISLIKKRTEKLKKDLEEINGNTQKETNNKNVKVKNTASINKLSQMIKLLTKAQLKGIIPILWDKKADQKSYEFDLDKLPDDKFRNLETYVVNCFNENKNTNFVNKNLNLHNQNKKDNKTNAIKKNGIIKSNGIYKNNINHQNSERKEENKKVDNSFSDSDSISSNSSL
jgi:hypothetical protein